METQTRPVFKGKPLIEIPSVNPQIGFLEGDFGKAFLEEYQGRVKADYNGNPALDVLRYNGKVVTGSNPFAVILANQILKQEGLRTANQADLEKALCLRIDLRGTYEDTGLVLRSDKDPNAYLAKDSMKQVKARNKKQRMPVNLFLNNLALRVDSASPQDLAFNLTDESELIYASILAGENNGKSFSETDKRTGLPTKLGEGSRVLYTRNSGLSRLYLDDDLNVGSDYANLGNSSDGGRVVVVSAEGTTPEKLKSELLQGINREYQAQVEELNARKAEAERAVIGIMSRKK